MGNKSEIDEPKQTEEVSVLEEGTVDSLDGVLEEEITPIEQQEEVKKPLSKNDESKVMMQEAENLINRANQEVQETQTVVAQNVAAFEKEKLTLSNTTITQSMILLEKTGYDYNQELPEEPFEISLGTTTEDVRVSNISSGAFTGLLLAIVAMAATVAGWIYVAAQKTGVALDPQKMLQTPPTPAELEPLLAWIGGGMTGGTGNVQFGMATVGLSALFVGFMVYKLRVSLKESKNLKIAKNTYDRSHIYVEQQKESKTEMEKIDAHINEVTPLLESYRVLLDEENAKLQRVLHVEGQLEDSSEYHPTSQQIMRDTDRLMDRVEKLIMTPITKEGRLNEASQVALMEAKALYESFIAKLYAS